MRAGAHGVETCSGRTTSAPAALPLGSARNNTDAIGKHCPVASEAKHEISHDAAGEPGPGNGTARILRGPFIVEDFDDGECVIPVLSELQFFPVIYRRGRAFVSGHAAATGEQIAPSQPHKT